MANDSIPGMNSLPATATESIRLGKQWQVLGWVLLVGMAIGIVVRVGGFSAAKFVPEQAIGTLGTVALFCIMQARLLHERAQRLAYQETRKPSDAA